ncbi:MAG: hypothetical protein Q9168_002075 [Polycauliona sp. 1 TL-2023]
MICTTLFLSLLSLNQAIAATIPAQPSLFQNAPDGAARTNQSEVAGDLRFQYTGPATVQEGVHCDGEIYGTELDLQSCNNALLRFNGDDTRLFTFGQRGFIPPAQQPLPLRRSSSESSAFPLDQKVVRRQGCWVKILTRHTGDGRCVIDVVRQLNSPARDTASFQAIKEAAARVISFCVNMPETHSYGGSVGPIGDSTCRARIDTLPQPMSDTVAWFDIWAAAEAINAMCVRVHREGFALDLG